MSEIGLRLLDNLGSSTDLIDFAIHAEDLGFDSVWFPHDAYRLNSWVLLSAVAARTKMITLGSRHNVYTTHPSEIATFISTLDQIAPRRTIVAPGLHNTDTLDWSGIPHEDPLRRTKESVEIIRRLLRGERVEFEGEEFQLTDRAFLRVPPYGEHIPVYVAPFGQEFVELSGEIGDGSVPMVTPPESAHLIVEAVQRGAKNGAKEPSSVPIAGFSWICVSEDGQLARDLVADIVCLFGAYINPEALAVLGLEVADFEPILDLTSHGEKDAARALVTPQMLKLAIHGTPSECIDQIQGIFDAGVTSAVLGGPLGPEPREAIDLIGKKILPHFHKTCT